MPRKLTDILAQADARLEYQAMGKPPLEPMAREVVGKPFPRAERLRGLYYDALSSATNEFPYWYTRTYMRLDNEVPVVRRALALESAFRHLTPTIFPGELLVMGKTHHYRGSFPMPWLSEGYYMAAETQLYQEALARGSASADVVSTFGSGGGNVTKSLGPVVSIAGKFGIRKEEVPAMLRVAHAWEGRSVDDVGHKYEQMVPGYEIKEALMKSVACMFDSGYTLPQGREVVNYYYPLQFGFDELISMAERKKGEVAGHPDGDGLTGMNRLYNYEAVSHVLRGVQAWILNYAQEARRLEAMEGESAQRAEYADIAECLEWIAHRPPRTFHEALQLSWTVHVAVLDEDVISGLSPGRLGQILWPWYEQDIAAGRLDEQRALELLECLRVKYTCLDCFASMGVVGGVLSGNTFNNLSIGGLDRNGSPANNRLEELIIQAAMTCASTQPTLTLLYDDKLPESFLLKAMECIKTGTGYPAVVNNRTGIEFLMNQYGPEGMDLEEARAIAIGGCLETSPCSWMPLVLNGRSYWIPGGSGQPTSVGVHFLSLPKILELVLFDGIDQRTGLRVFPPHGRTLASYEELFDQVKAYFARAVEVLALANNIQHDVWRKNNMAIFNSLLKPDCLESGHLIDELGYRYNATHNVETCGTINLINSLAALKSLVYDRGCISIAGLRKALADNFGFKTADEVGSFSLSSQEKRGESTEHDRTHVECLTAPKYGNDNPYVDDILKEWEDWFCAKCREYESLNARPYYACQISVSTHAPMGAVTMATPDGRLAGTTFADASMSAYPGTDRQGPYALFSSATCWDHAQSQNSQLNLKIHPSAIHGRAGTKKLLELTRSYMRKGGFHIQYNVVDSRILKHAQEHPEEYRDLLVRVAGFTQYWVEIGKPIQDEIIARTEYEGVQS